MRDVLRDLTPPVMWRFFARSMMRRTNRQWTFGAEQPPEFYDHTFRAAHWKQHYTDSHYYPLWTVIADRVRRHGTKRIVDIGCGPGQVACLMRDLKIDHYLGLDFSGERIAHAKQVCPEFEFVQADIFQTDVLETAAYDTVLVMEFLEHVEEDLAVLRRLRRDTYVLATVPNFPATGHVRYFHDADEVIARYAVR